MEKETQLTRQTTSAQTDKPQPTKAERFEALFDEWQKDKDPEKVKKIAKLAKAETTLRDRLANSVNLYEQTIHAKIEKAVSGSPMVKECMIAGCEKLRDELGYHTATPLERITIEHIVLCWIDLSLNENLLVSQTSNSAIETLQKRVEFSSKRFNRAMLTLSKMRKMNLTIQINNAGQQVVNNG